MSAVTPKPLDADQPRPKKYSAVNTQLNNGTTGAYQQWKRRVTRNTVFAVTFSSMTLEELNDLFDAIDPKTVEKAEVANG